MYNNEASRPVRFCLYYMKIVLMIAVSGLFTEAVNQVQAILLSIIMAIFFVVPVVIVQKLLAATNKFIVGVGVVLFFAFSLVGLYVCLTVAALLGSERANEWAFNYVTSFLTNFCFSSPVICMAKLFLFDTFAKMQGSLLGKIIVVAGGEELARLFN
jgi:hypothetical protein